MKKVVYIVCLIFLSCEEVIDVDLQQTLGQIVIDAELSRPIGSEEGQLQVLVAKTYDFYGSETPVVTNANISLHVGDESWNVTHQKEGQYSVDIPSLVADTSYKLSVEVDGKTYIAEEELVLSGSFDKVVQGDGQLFSGTETEALVTLTDLPGLENYYLFDFGYNNLLVTRDRFYDGKEFTFSFFYDDLFPKNTEVNIRMVGIDEAFFSYMQILLSHSGQNGGGPFATATSTLLGNFVNPNDETAIALGYFRVVEQKSLPFTAE